MFFDKKESLYIFLSTTYWRTWNVVFNR